MDSLISFHAFLDFLNLIFPFTKFCSFFFGNSGLYFMCLIQYSVRSVLLGTMFILEHTHTFLGYRKLQQEFV